MKCENDTNEILKTISFKRINYLVIDGLNNIDFLSNETLSELKRLEFNFKVNDISIFNHIKFTNLQKIIFNNDEIISEGFSSLNIFKQLKITSIKIDKENNKYKCDLSCKYPEFHCKFIFNDINFLKEEFLANLEYINKKSYAYISQTIINEKAECFTYDEIKNSFHIFKNMDAYSLDIKYINNKYKCYSEFYYYDCKLNFNFNFDDLNFILDDMFSGARIMSFSDLKFNDLLGITKEKFPKLEKLNFKDNNIESASFFTELKKLSVRFGRYESNINKCNSELFDCLDGGEFTIYKIKSNEKKEIEIYYYSPFYLCICINDFSKINTNKLYKSCQELSLNNLGLTDEDIKFLDRDEFSELKYLNLDGNKITEINFLGKLKSLNKVSLKDNLITKGIEVINNDSNKIIESLKVRLKEDDNNYHIISLKYSERYRNYSDLSFDYLSEVNSNLEILKILKFEKMLYLDLSNLKLKNMDFLKNEDLYKHCSLNLNNNLIEDISILTGENFHNLISVSIRGNPIRKGIDVLNKEYFKCIYMDLQINEIGSEYKVLTSFKFPNISLEFYINNFNEVYNILDIKNTYIRLLNTDTYELQSLEKELLINQSQEQKELFDNIHSLTDFFNNHNTHNINIIQEDNETKIIKNDNLIFSDANKDKLEKALSFINNKSGLALSIYELNLENLKNNTEILLQNLAFLYVKNLKLNKCDFNLDNLKYLYKSSVKNIVFKETSGDIKELCENDNLINLDVLDLSNNPNLTNLCELKNAKFTNLSRFSLANNNLSDLNEISMGDYNFYVSDLDLSNNNISNVAPIKAFDDLKTLNLENNKISNEKSTDDDLKEIIEKNPYCRIYLKGNDNNGVGVGIFQI